MTGPGIRLRLFLAFVLVAVPPLGLSAFAVTALVTRRSDADADDRLERALVAVRTRLEELRLRAEAQVAAVVAQDLPGRDPAPEAVRTLAAALGEARDLPALEILDAGDRVLSSRHWPAGYGLVEPDAPLAPDASIRLVTVEQGYGATQRLALMPSRPGVFRGASVLVRGGVFLDEEFVAGLSRLLGVEVGLRDAAGGLVVAPRDSPLSRWTDRPLSASATRGDVFLGEAYRYRAAPLGAGLWLVVAASRAPLDRARADIRRYGLGIGGMALLGALLASLALSGRIARPVSDLAEGARRVASGNLWSTVPVGASDEIGDLAQAFNAMTLELRSSRERLLQAERVAAWREMARRLAHELKNPLFPIQLSIETLQRAASASRADFLALFSESSQTILQELRALTGIIDEFSEFARMPRPELRPTDLNALVAQVLSLYEARSAGVVRVSELDPLLPRIGADPALLSRALGNLVANALEAMEGGGTLRVKTSRRGASVVLEVQDSGPGLTEEQRARLFSPYYTTKRGGTGLGLAIVQGIVSDHGGRIEVPSTAGAGTTFALVFPAEQAPPSEATPTP